MATDDVDTITRELALLAGEAFAQLRLEPAGFRRMPCEHEASPSVDLVYAHDRDVVLIQTLAGDETLRTARTADGHVVEAGTRAYVELAIASLHPRAPEVAEHIAMALALRTLRYFEVRQPIDEAGKLGDIEIRQFAL